MRALDHARSDRAISVIALVLWGVLAGCALAGCGGGASFRAGVYRDGEARYRVGPEGRGWQSLAVDDQNDLAFHDPANAAVVQVNATCDPGSDVPLTALTNHLLIGFTERDVREQRLVPLDGREALRTHVIARLDGVPRELLFYVLKKNECVYDFALIAPPGPEFTSAVSQFEPFVMGFSTEVQ